MPSRVTGRGNCIPFGGAAVGENRDVSEGEDSKCRKERCGTLGVGGMISAMLRVKDVWSDAGVRMVRFAGFRRAVFVGRCIGDGGAEKLCVGTSAIEAVEIEGREGEGGIFKDKFLRFRARLAGDTARVLEIMVAGYGDKEDTCISECMAILSEISGILVDFG